MASKRAKGGKGGKGAKAAATLMRTHSEDHGGISDADTIPEEENECQDVVVHKQVPETIKGYARTPASVEEGLMFARNAALSPRDAALTRAKARGFLQQLRNNPNYWRNVDVKFKVTPPAGTTPGDVTVIHESNAATKARVALKQMAPFDESRGIILPPATSGPKFIFLGFEGNFGCSGEFPPTTLSESKATLPLNCPSASDTLETYGLDDEIVREIRAAMAWLRETELAYVTAACRSQTTTEDAAQAAIVKAFEAMDSEAKNDSMAARVIRGKPPYERLKVTQKVWANGPKPKKDEPAAPAKKRVTMEDIHPAMNEIRAHPIFYCGAGPDGQRRFDNLNEACWGVELQPKTRVVRHNYIPVTTDAGTALSYDAIAAITRPEADGQPVFVAVIACFRHSTRGYNLLTRLERAIYLGHAPKAVYMHVTLAPDSGLTLQLLPSVDECMALMPMPDDAAVSGAGLAITAGPTITEMGEEEEEE